MTQHDQPAPRPDAPPSWYVAALAQSASDRSALAARAGRAVAAREHALHAVRGFEIALASADADEDVAPWRVELGLNRIAIGDVEGGTEALRSRDEVMMMLAGTDEEDVPMLATHLINAAERALGAGETAAATAACFEAVRLGWGSNDLDVQHRAMSLLRQASEENPGAVVAGVEEQTGPLHEAIGAVRARLADGDEHAAAELKEALRHYASLEHLLAGAYSVMGARDERSAAEQRAHAASTDPVFGTEDDDTPRRQGRWDLRQAHLTEGRDAVTRFVEDRLPVDPAQDSVEQNVLRMRAKLMEASRSEPVLAGVNLREARDLRESLAVRLTSAYEAEALAHAPADADEASQARMHHSAQDRAARHAAAEFVDALGACLYGSDRSVVRSLVQEGEIVLGSAPKDFASDLLQMWARAIVDIDESFGDGYSPDALRATVRAKLEGERAGADPWEHGLDRSFAKVVREFAETGRLAQVLEMIAPDTTDDLQERTLRADIASDACVTALGTDLADDARAATRLRAVELALEGGFPLDPGPHGKRSAALRLEGLMDEGIGDEELGAIRAHLERLTSGPEPDRHLMSRARFDAEMGLVSGYAICAARAGATTAEELAPLGNRVVERARSLVEDHRSAWGEPAAIEVLEDLTDTLVRHGSADLARHLALGALDDCPEGSTARHRFETIVGDIERVTAAVETGPERLAELAHDIRSGSFAYYLVRGILMAEQQPEMLLADVPDIDDDAAARRDAPATTTLDDELARLLGSLQFGPTSDDVFAAPWAGDEAPRTTPEEHELEELEEGASGHRPALDGTGVDSPLDEGLGMTESEINGPEEPGIEL